MILKMPHLISVIVSDTMHFPGGLWGGLLGGLLGGLGGGAIAVTTTADQMHGNAVSLGACRVLYSNSAVLDPPTRPKMQRDVGKGHRKCTLAHQLPSFYFMGMHPHGRCAHPHGRCAHPHGPCAHPHAPCAHPHGRCAHPHAPCAHPHSPCAHPHGPCVLCSLCMRPVLSCHCDTSLRHWALGGVLARRARAGHLFLTIPHPCLFLPPLTKQSGEPSRPV